MKYLILIFITLPLICFSQKKYNSLLFAKMESYRLDSLLYSHSLIVVPFKNYEVWDARRDTNSIGFSSNENGTAKSILKWVENEVDSFVKYNYTFNKKNNDPATLLLIIRNLRVSDFTDNINNNSKNWNSAEF